MKRRSTFIEAARDADAPAIAALLRDAGLPDGDFKAHLANFLVVRDEAGGVAGAVGAEVHAPDALLRSLVVTPALRGAGLGDELLRRLDTLAVSWGIQRWWLLTTTAEAFFAARGFAGVDRTRAPGAIRRTGQFDGGCSGAAECMMRERG